MTPNNNQQKVQGVLTVCGTPIGNLEDITRRGLKCLAEADAVVCEDTRRSVKLLNYYNITGKKMISYHRHSSSRRVTEILNMLHSGFDLALITDAGMPGLSDPGSELVDKALKENLKVKVVPGPSAVTAALSISGFSSNCFMFWGFLSSSKNKRKKELEALSRKSEAVVLFEAPHRIVATLQEMQGLMENRQLAVIKELTKKYEQIFRGSPAELAEKISRHRPRGEYVMVLSPFRQNEPRQSEPDEVDTALVKEDLRKLIAAGIPTAQAAKSVSLIRGVNRNKMYMLALDLQNDKHG